MKSWTVLGLLLPLLGACGDDDGSASNNQNGNLNNHNDPVCGNGLLESGELCDEGAANSDTAPDTCRTSCRPAYCGDGVMDASELCDDGNSSNEDGCLTDCAQGAGCCVPNACGDGFVDARPDGGDGQVEACDDGNLADGDACRSDCLQDLTVCGNGDLEQGETCDDGAAANSDTIPDACRKTCQVPGCGDRVIDVLHGETCDGTNLGDLSCSDLDPLLGDGTLGCDPVSCVFDTSGCIPLECTLGQARPCYTPDVGCTFDGVSWACQSPCQTGQEECLNGFWSGQCNNELGPSLEICDGQDNDCNGIMDDGSASSSCGVLAHSYAECSVVSVCLPTSNCIPGWMDADGNANTGCEVCDTSPTENCIDLIDNNCDGLIDCADPDCSTDPAC